MRRGWEQGLHGRRVSVKRGGGGCRKVGGAVWEGAEGEAAREAGKC